jgi:ferredoxin
MNAVTATTSITKVSCPTCWSSNCIAAQEFAPGQRYGHDWANGPMAAAHARWKDDRTPPASLEEAIARGFIKPKNAPAESVTGTESVTQESVTGEPDPESVTAPERACVECGKPLASARPNARFCSTACRMKAHRRDAATEKAATPA